MHGYNPRSWFGLSWHCRSFVQVRHWIMEVGEQVAMEVVKTQQPYWRADDHHPFSSTRDAGPVHPLGRTWPFRVPGLQQIVKVIHRGTDQDVNSVPEVTISISIRSPSGTRCILLASAQKNQSYRYQSTTTPGRTGGNQTLGPSTHCDV